MTQEEIQEFIANAPAKVGDVVWAWNGMGDERHKGVLVGFDGEDMDETPYRVYFDQQSYWLRHIAPYTAPKKRPMTHKECLELVGKWVFKAPDGAIYSSWSTFADIPSRKGCPISELVEPLENSPWRALEVEE